MSRLMESLEQVETRYLICTVLQYACGALQFRLLHLVLTIFTGQSWLCMHVPVLMKLGNFRGYFCILENING